MKISVTLVVLSALVALCASQEISKRKCIGCDYAYKCSNYEDPVWTLTQNTVCEVFRNGCQLGSENCNRRKLCLPEAQVVEKELCQQFCTTYCETVNIQPTCGYYNNEMRNFGSECEINNYNCATGTTFKVYSQGPCPSPTAASLM